MKSKIIQIQVDNYHLYALTDDGGVYIKIDWEGEWQEIDTNLPG